MPGLARLTEHYDAKYKASDFRKVTPVPLVRYPKDRRQMAVHLASQDAVGSYLEIGAGDGGTILALLELYDQLVGTDLSSIRVLEMRSLFQHDSKVQILQNNLEVDKLPFEDERFDTVAMIDVIEHIVDPIGALIEIQRVLKPKGRLIVHTPNIAKWTRRVKLLAGYFPSTASYEEGLMCHDKKTPTDLHDEGHLHYFTFRSLRRLAIERAGFARMEVCGYGKPVLCKVWPGMFSELSAIVYK
jgi:ubiquinone/menaquinone biosynthesis C-methylase UbiE